MRLRRIVLRTAGVLVIMLAVAVVAAWIVGRPVTPDAFYTSAEAAGPPGHLLAVEPYSFEVPEGGTAWRILYSTTRIDGSPAVASAVVMVPTGSSGRLRPIAWAHGTTGMAQGCAPSIIGPFDNVPALAELLRQGWAYVGTDYAGMGTSGGHAYLVGEDAARAVLDAVRAATAMAEAEISGETVVWGHSQGGNSALWTDMIAPDYAPEVQVLGVAGLAPATDIPGLIRSAQGGAFGKIISSYVIQAYSETYDDVVSADYVSGLSGVLAADISGRCLELFSALETLLMPAAGIFHTDPGSGPLGERLQQNVPIGPFSMPVFIGQGAADDLVLERLQRPFAAGLCARGERLDYRVYEGRETYHWWQRIHRRGRIWWPGRGTGSRGATRRPSVADYNCKETFANICLRT